MKYSLRRISDNEGCDGKRSNSVKINQPEAPNDIVSIRPVVGCSMVVHDSFSTWWQTTEITEILENTPTAVKFKTLNSEYIWKIIQ